MQITSGIRAILSIPWIYELSQHLMGASLHRPKFVARFINPFNVQTILDIGCGPAGILSYLSNQEYYGFDASSLYIENARSRFGSRGHFYAHELTEAELALLPKFDLVIMHGLLHHLDNDSAINLVRIAYQALKNGGRLVTADGCLVEGQNPLAKWLIKYDRGQNIRDQAGYMRLAEPVFEKIESIISHQHWPPYTLCYLQCTRCT